MFWMRALLPLVLAVSLFTPAAQADRARYAAFVVDQNTGTVLHSRRSQAERHPASLTKMMTLYMLFEALETGEIGLHDTIRVSAHAASQPPSHLALNAGDRISVEDAIGALVVKSANDVAVAVGERLGGGETRFAEIMTLRAEELGLTQTRFRNASGLPDRRQVTSARDMARLAIALQRDFPQYFHYFDMPRFRYNGVTYRNHNSLVGRVDGVDGLKTGYIRASGFNIVVSAERDDHRLVTVVMGGPSAAARDAHAEELLNAAFSALEHRQDSRLFATLETPRINPVRQQMLIARDVASLGLEAPVEMGSASDAPPVQIELRTPDETTDLREDEPRLSLAESGNWAVQVGAYLDAPAAEDRIEDVRPLAGELAAAQGMARSVDIGDRRLWRARFEGLSHEAARQACATLTTAGEDCNLIAPGR